MTAYTAPLELKKLKKKKQYIQNEILAQIQ